nr:MAG TPA: hypothetical protein [Caudoviricetes sp.]
MAVAMMRMRLLSFMWVVYVYLFRSLVLVVEIHDRLQVIAFHMSINAPASHCLHEGFAVPFFETNLTFPAVNDEWYWLPYEFLGLPFLSTLHPLLAPLPPIYSLPPFARVFVVRRRFAGSSPRVRGTPVRHHV